MHVLALRSPQQRALRRHRRVEWWRLALALDHTGDCGVRRAVLLAATTSGECATLLGSETEDELQRRCGGLLV
jgi:hypothetical protein